MPNLYKSFYLQDILKIINDVALEAMLTPVFNAEGNENGFVAFYNDGIRTMAEKLAESFNMEATKNE